MENLKKTVMMVSLVIAGLMMPARAEIATTEEALNVANNWITLIIQRKGNWGGAKAAWVNDVKEFKRGHRQLGYFCRVKPDGFIVISLYKELAPVKAYSDVGSLNPDCDAGLTDVIKLGMERVINTIEEQSGPVESVRAQDLQNILEINYSDAWRALEADVPSFQQKLDSGIIEMDYQESEVLLKSNWDQLDPYNRYCFVPDGDDCPSLRCQAGCHAIAAAQIMRYWAWPPYGVGSTYNDPYDWPNMPDDAKGCKIPEQVEAVSEICREAGLASEMDYCGGDASDGRACASGTEFPKVEDAYENTFRYSPACVRRRRNDYTATEWYNLLKNEFIANRPVHYTIKEHALVADGWREVLIGGVLTRQYHMNYGQGNECNDVNTSCNTWFNLDGLYHYAGDTMDEDILDNLYPSQRQSNIFSGIQNILSPPYRYFDMDATSIGAVFVAGQNLQFLPRITVTCTSTTGDYIGFEGTSAGNTRMFSIAGMKVAEMQIYDGDIRLYQNGSLSFH